MTKIMKELWNLEEIYHALYEQCPDQFFNCTNFICRDENCFACWQREIPEVTVKEKENEEMLNVGDSKIEHPDTDAPKTEEKRTIYAHIGTFGYALEPNDNVHEDTRWSKENPYISEKAKKAMEEHREELSLLANNKPRILDSGDRTEFPSGAVRDLREGKGRCDLMPLDVVSEYFNYRDPDNILINIYSFQRTGDRRLLDTALSHFAEKRRWDEHTMFLEVAIHFEEGAKKYGDSNWQRGIPVRCYIDSAVRHYLKFLRGDKDEMHDRAFCWNLLCAIWTCKHKPELNDYRKKEN